MNFELAGLTAISPVFFACFVGDTTKQYLRKFILTCISVVVEVDFMSLIRYIYVEYINQAFSVCTQANKKDCRSSPKRCGVFKIKNKYKKEKFWFRSLNEEKIKKINMEIEDEIIKIFDKNILKKINSIIDEQQKDLIIMSKNKIGGMTTHFLGSGIEFLCIVGLGIGLSHFCFIGFTLYFILEFGFYKKRDEKTKEIIDQNIKKFLYKMEQKYIFLNLLLIREMAEGYNKSIDEFNKYINEFETEEYIE